MRNTSRDEWTVVAAPPAARRVSIEVFRCLTTPTLAEYSALARTVSARAEQMAGRMWHQHQLCYTQLEHAWIIPFYWKNPSVCTRLNHVVGRGCAAHRAGTCSREHVCMLCGERGHGMFEAAGDRPVCPLYQRLLDALQPQALQQGRTFSQYMCEAFWNRFT